MQRMRQWIDRLWVTVRQKMPVRMNRGVWLDGAIFLANCWLVPRITALSCNDGYQRMDYAVILLLSIVLYTLGAGLKRNPLQARLARQERAGAASWAQVGLFVLIVMQFGLYLISFLVAAEAVQVRFPDVAYIPAMESMWTMVLSLTAAGVPVCMTVRALMALRKKEAVSENALRRQEWFADNALYFSAVISLSLWDGLLMKSLAGQGPYAWYMGVLLMVLITVPFAIFYAAPRILFLVEDYRRTMTWIRIATVMLPLTMELLG